MYLMCQNMIINQFILCQDIILQGGDCGPADVLDYLIDGHLAGGNGTQSVVIHKFRQSFPLHTHFCLTRVLRLVRTMLILCYDISPSRFRSNLSDFLLCLLICSFLIRWTVLQRTSIVMEQITTPPASATSSTALAQQQIKKNFRQYSVF